jgi:hypothetical protein
VCLDKELKKQDIFLLNNPESSNYSTVSGDGFPIITYKTFKKIFEYRGTITAEHGDGISRTTFIKL